MSIKSGFSKFLESRFKNGAIAPFTRFLRIRKKYKAGLFKFITYNYWVKALLQTKKLLRSDDGKQNLAPAIRSHGI